MMVQRVARLEAFPTGEPRRIANDAECLGYGDGPSARLHQWNRGAEVIFWKVAPLSTVFELSLGRGVVFSIDWPLPATPALEQNRQFPFEGLGLTQAITRGYHGRV